MSVNKIYDVIIIGGSYSGLAAGMALGRSLRKVLFIDSGRPCNISAPHSHNFLTQDGKSPQEILNTARNQIAKYDTVRFISDIAVAGEKTENGYKISTLTGDKFEAKKLIFATGVRDIMPDIQGFKECWGISAIHCPYCHGYEFRNAKTGIIGNGEYGIEFSRLISNWTNELTLFTNGKSTLSEDESEKLYKHKIRITESEIVKFEHTEGKIQKVIFKDGSSENVNALYSHPNFEQHCDIPKELSCEITEHGFIKTDEHQKTSVYGIYACGDNTTPLRTIANAVAMGTLAGAMANKYLIYEEF